MTYSWTLNALFKLKSDCSHLATNLIFVIYGVGREWARVTHNTYEAIAITRLKLKVVFAATANNSSTPSIANLAGWLRNSWSFPWCVNHTNHIANIYLNSYLRKFFYLFKQFQYVIINDRFMKTSNTHLCSMEADHFNVKLMNWGGLILPNNKFILYTWTKLECYQMKKSIVARCLIAITL